MRDGERFFADGRDNANYELAQQQMRLAGDWRLGLRQQVLARLAAFGRQHDAAVQTAGGFGGYAGWRRSERGQFISNMSAVNGRQIAGDGRFVTVGGWDGALGGGGFGGSGFYLDRPMRQGQFGVDDLSSLSSRYDWLSENRYSQDFGGVALQPIEFDGAYAGKPGAGEEHIWMELGQRRRERYAVNVDDDSLIDLLDNSKELSELRSACRCRRLRAASRCWI